MNRTKKPVRTVRVSDCVWNRMNMHRKVHGLGWDQYFERSLKADYEYQRNLKNKINK